MKLAELLLPEFDHEMANTRRVLEQIPDDKLDWKAWPQGNSIGWVGAHLAEIPGWATGSLLQDSWDVNPVGGQPYQSPKATSRQQLLSIFDANVAAAHAALAGASDEQLFQSWSLLSAGQPIFTMPRLGVIRTWVLNHTIHHRAFLCAYLRQNGIEVPAMYGTG